MRDLPLSRDLLALARELLLDELAPLLPPERRRDAHLIATVIAIAAREQERAGWRAEIDGLLGQFYGEAAPPPGPLAARPVPEAAALRRFAADLRNGAFETSPSRMALARSILWRLTIARLREGNPHFLAANGLHEAGGRET